MIQTIVLVIAVFVVLVFSYFTILNIIQASIDYYHYSSSFNKLSKLRQLRFNSVINIIFISIALSYIIWYCN